MLAEKGVLCTANLGTLCVGVSSIKLGSSKESQELAPGRKASPWFSGDSTTLASVNLPSNSAANAALCSSPRAVEDIGGPLVSVKTWTPLGSRPIETGRPLQARKQRVDDATALALICMQVRLQCS